MIWKDAKNISRGDDNFQLSLWVVEVCRWTRVKDEGYV